MSVAIRHKLSSLFLVMRMTSIQFFINNDTNHTIEWNFFSFTYLFEKVVERRNQSMQWKKLNVSIHSLLNNLAILIKMMNLMSGHICPRIQLTQDLEVNMYLCLYMNFQHCQKCHNHCRSYFFIREYLLLMGAETDSFQAAVLQFK